LDAALHAILPALNQSVGHRFRFFFGEGLQFNSLEHPGTLLSKCATELGGQLGFPAGVRIFIASSCPANTVKGHPWIGQSAYVYSATVPAARPAAEYKARLIPCREGVAIPLEDVRILWQR
jgi:hypothetical protein